MAERSITSDILTDLATQYVAVGFVFRDALNPTEPCIICLDLVHNVTGEKPKASKCCQCALHSTCIYQWLNSQYQRGIDHNHWGCPHCRSPVKNIADNPLPCIICHQREVRAIYYEPLPRSVPCCHQVMHQQCLYNYVLVSQIAASHTTESFPCPRCRRTLSLSLRTATHMATMDINLRQPPTPRPPSTTPSSSRSSSPVDPPPLQQSLRRQSQPRPRRRQPP